MKKRKYFLLLQNRTQLDFMHIKGDVGVRVFLPSYITSDRFKKISTESETICGETPEACADILKSKYSDYDVFYLNVSIIEDEEEYKRIAFDLDLQSDITVAFVCIPRNAPEYTQDPAAYRIFCVDFTLEKYYNDYRSWEVYVVDEKFSKNYLDSCGFFRAFGNIKRYEPSEKKFFEKCKATYGIPESEIMLAKYIMNTEVANRKIVYKITPEFAKKFRGEKNEKE
jgi:hypothetical protein